MTGGRNIASVQEGVDGVGASVDASGAHNPNVLRYKDKAGIGVRCSK